MNDEMKLPVSEVLAELNSVEFYQTKSQLGAGTYRVIEHDGEVNYAVLNDFHGESWYSEEEYEHAMSENFRDAYLEQQLMFEPDDQEELMDSWDNAMIRQEGERLADEHSAANLEGWDGTIKPCDGGLDDLIVDTTKPVKSLGDLLREHMANTHPPVETDEMQMAEYEISTQEKYDEAVARRGTVMPIYISADDMSEAEYENHRTELGAYNQRSSEQLDRAMEAK